MSTTTEPMLNVNVRWMIRRELPEVLDIEHLSFEFPWYEADFIRVLRQTNAVGMVAAKADDSIAGFFIYLLHKTRIEVVNFAVHPRDRRQGVGAQMVAKLYGKLNGDRRTQLKTKIRESNLTGLLFAKSQGFKAVDLLHGEYEETDDDAIVLVKRLSPNV